MTHHEDNCLLWHFAMWVVRLFFYCAVGIVCAVLLIRCANAEPIFYHGFEDEAPGADPCADPLVAPEGWVLRMKPWDLAFTTPGTRPLAVYPNSSGIPVPVPGYESYPSSKYRKGEVVSIPFVALPNTTVRMTWDTAQSGTNYRQPRPADGMFVGVSQCPWDVRSTPRCSRVSGLDTLVLSSLEDPGSACPLIPHATYYITVVMADPRDGLELGEHTCQDVPNSQDGCDVQMRHSGN